MQIARAIFDHHKEEAIAGALAMSKHTVRTHCKRMYGKLGVNNHLELALRLVSEFLALTGSETGNLPPICSEYLSGRCLGPRRSAKRSAG
jgi:hypothetical protein